MGRQDRNTSGFNCREGGEKDNPSQILQHGETLIAGKSGVFMCDNFRACKECQAGNVPGCTDRQNGSYINFGIRKGE